MRTQGLPGISHATLMKRCETACVRVLLVEDEAKMAKVLRRGLEQEGYAVDSVADGEHAVGRGATEDYDAIVLDVTLPGRDGFSVCHELRSDVRWAPSL